MTKSPAIGIDLGTTYSCVAAWQEGQVEIMINDQGNRMTPSYVAFTDTERLLGDVAKYQAAKNTSNTVYDAKRLIGRKFDDSQLQRDIERWPFKVVNDGGKPKIQVEFKGERKTFAPEEISAMILVKMKETAEFNLGVAVQDAVVTVPAHFNDSQRQATKDAAAIAGLNVLRIINEPTAAALAYGLDRPCEGERNVLIYDLGGGTVDVSILTIDDTAWFEVKATAGDAHLGGQDFDDRLVSYLVGEFRRKCQGDLSPKGLRRLRTEAERVKRTLSTRTVTSIELDGLCEGVDFYTSISRARFEELCSDLFAASLVPVEKVLSAANTPKEAISDIVLVGGSTRIPKIRQILSSFFDKEPLATPVDPDEAVAYGAAVQAAVLSGGCPIPNLLLLDVAPLSLGIETAGGCMTRIIECNTKLPCERSQTFTTSKDNQAAVSIRVFEGEQALTKDNNLLGTFDLTGIPPAPKGMPKIEVTFDLDANGILNVTAKDTSSVISKNITIKNDKGGLSQKELDRMVSDAEQYNDNDKLHRQRLEAGNQLEFCVIRYALTVQEYEEEITAEEKTMVEEKCQDCLDWLDKNSSAEKRTFEEKQKELVETCSLVMSKISKAHYDQTGEKYLEASRISTSPGIPMIEESD